MFEHHFNAGALLFLIFVYNNYRLCVVWNRLFYDRSFVIWVLNSTEKLLYLGFNLVNIYVTYDDQTLVIRMVPLMIIVDKFFAFKVIYDAH